jgi:hypothetical protein
VHTGCSKGCNETAQKLNGRRLKLAPMLVALRAFAPAAAPKASSEDHSLWVIYGMVSLLGSAQRNDLSGETHVQLVCACCRC